MNRSPISTNGCPTPEAVEQVLQAADNDADFEALMAHLRQCRRCQAMWAEFDDQSPEPPGSQRASDLSAVPPEVLRRLKQMNVYSQGGSRGEVHRRHGPDGSSGRLEVRCPSCHAPIEVAVDTLLTDLTCSACGSHFSLVDQDKAAQTATPLSEIGRFELIGRVGFGSFGSVWKARDKELDRWVAIKIPRHGGMTARDQENFFREARAAAQLSHPHIVRVYEVGRDGDNAYIVSDFVRGDPLNDWLMGQQLTSREAAALCAKIADALHHAHEQGVIHRDLKPANIMIDAEGEPHLTDFGLARREIGEVTMTLDGQVLGTPAYMSPEQAVGDAHTADCRSDVYSLGVILFQLLTGELPFRGNARMIMNQVIHDEPPSPRQFNGNIDRDLETVTLKCMEKLPARRYQTARDVAGELRRFMAGQPITARPIGWLERKWRWCRAHPAAAGLTAAIPITAVAVAVIATIAALRIDEERRNATGNLYQSLVREASALRAGRTPGYRARAWELLQQAAGLDTSLVNPEMLRQEAVNSMGDVLALEPVVQQFDSKVTCVALGDTNESVYVGTEDGTIAIANARTRQSSAIGSAGAPISILSISAGGRLLASATTDGKVHLWSCDESNRWSLSNTIAGTGELIALAVEGPGDCVAVRRAEFECELCVFGQSPSARPLAVPDRVFSAAIDGPRRRVALGSASGTITVFDRETAAHISTSSPGVGPIQDLSFAANSKRLACAGGDGFAFIDADTGERLSHNRETGCKAVALTSSGGLCAVSDPQGRVRLWNLVSNSKFGDIVVEELNSSLDYSVADTIAFSDDGRWCCLASGRAVRVWDLWRTPEMMTLEPHQGGVPGIAFSPNGKQIASVGKDGRCVVSDLETGRAISTFDGDKTRPLQSVAYDDSGQLLVAAGWGDGIRIWNVRTGTLLTHLLEGRSIWCVRFNRDGTKLAAAGDGGVWLWQLGDAHSGKLILTELKHVESPTIFFCTFSPQDDTLYWSDDVLTSLDAARNEIRSYKNARLAREVIPFRLFSDGQKAILITSQGHLQLYDLPSQRLLDKIPDGDPSPSRATGVALSESGRRIAYRSKGPGLDVLDLNERTISMRLPTSPTGSSIWYWTWSADGRQLATSCADGRIYVWNVGKVLKQIRDVGQFEGKMQ